MSIHKLTCCEFMSRFRKWLYDSSGYLPVSQQATQRSDWLLMPLSKFSCTSKVEIVSHCQSISLLSPVFVLHCSYLLIWNESIWTSICAEPFQSLTPDNRWNIKTLRLNRCTLNNTKESISCALYLPLSGGDWFISKMQLWPYSQFNMTLTK